MQSNLIAIKGGEKMALEKKYVVQKSFRIDAKLEKDLEALSVKLNRPQNDLANLALEMLMEDNKMWFAENILVDSCYEYFELNREKCHCEIGNVTVDLIVNEDCSTTYSGKVCTDAGEILDEWSYIYEDEVNLDEKLKENLRQVALAHLFSKTEIIDKYLKQRLNYR